jgi:hypothetical protein
VYHLAKILRNLVIIFALIFEAIEEYVDLKSASSYGWRVDLERIRSKYFVEMMKGKEGATPLPP